MATKEPKQKEIKCWNVRDQINFRGSMSIGAYNRSHASRLILQSRGITPENQDEKYYKSLVKSANRELRDYGHETWGNAMEKLVPIPEVGLWRQDANTGEIYRVI